MLRFFGIVRVEYVAKNAVRVRHFNGFLIEIGLEQLDLVRAQRNGAPNHGQGILVFIPAHADPQIGGVCHDPLDHGVRGGHKVNMLLAVVFSNQRDDLLDHGILEVFIPNFHVDIHNGPSREFLQDLLKGGDLQALELFSVLRAEIQRQQLLVGVLVDFSASVADAVKRAVVTGNQYAVLGGPQIKFNFLCSKRHCRAKGGHAVFGSNRIEASMGAKTGVGHDAVKGNDRRAAVAVKPRSAPFLYVFVMRLALAHMSRGLVVFCRRIDLTDPKSHAVFHIQQLLSLGGEHRAAAAHLGRLTQGDRRADEIGVGLIAKEGIDDGKRLVGVGPLQRAADDDIDLFAGEHGEALVEIKIIAGQKGKAKPFQFQNIGRSALVAVRHVKLVTALGIGFDLAGRGMRLEIPTDEVALAVKGVGGVANPVFGFVSRVDKHQRVTPFCRLACFLQQNGVVLIHCSIKSVLALHVGKSVAVFGQNDQIKAFVTLLQQIEQAPKARVKILFVKGITGLNDTNFHKTLLLLSSFVFSLPRYGIYRFR